MAITRPRADQIGSGNIVNTEFEFIDTLDQNIGKDDSVQFAGLTITPSSGTTAAIINSNSEDYDTIIRGDTDDNLLFVNAGTDRVGFGLNNPAAKVDIYHATTADAATVYDTVLQSSVNTNSINAGVANNYGFTGQAYGGSDGAGSSTVNIGGNFNAFGAVGTNSGLVSNRAIQCWAANGDSNYAIYVSAGDIYSEAGNLSLVSGGINVSTSVVAGTYLRAPDINSVGNTNLKFNIGGYPNETWVYTDATNHNDEVLWTRRTWKGDVRVSKTDSIGSITESAGTCYGYYPYFNDSSYYGGAYDGGQLYIPHIANGLVFCDNDSPYNIWAAFDGTTGYLLLDNDPWNMIHARYKLDVNGTLRLQGTNQLAFGGDTTSDRSSYIYDDGTAIIVNSHGTDQITMGVPGEPLRIKGSAGQCVGFWNSSDALMGLIGDIWNNGQMTVLSNTAPIVLYTTGAKLEATPAGSVGIGTVNEAIPAGLFCVFQPTACVGTVSTAETTALIGVGTHFDTTLKAGDTITVDGETVRTVASVTDATNLDVTVAFDNTASDKTYTTGGGIRFQVNGNGTIYAGAAGAPLYTYGSAVFNESGGDNDFTVKGDTDDHLLWCDADEDAVWSGATSNPYGGTQKWYIQESSKNACVRCVCTSDTWAYGLSALAGHSNDGVTGYCVGFNAQASSHASNSGEGNSIGANLVANGVADGSGSTVYNKGISATANGEPTNSGTIVNYGGYFSATGGTTNYGVYIQAGGLTIESGDIVVSSGDVKLSGVIKIDNVQILKEQQSHIADLKTDYTTGDLDTEAELITALNTTNGKINAILAMLETHGLVASS